MMSDLGEKLIGEKILTRVPLTSLTAVRSTCKKWDAITKNCVLGSKAAKAPLHQFLTMNAKVYSLRINLEDSVNVSVKQVDFLNELEVSKVYQCDGLVLCVTVVKDKDEKPKLLLWNPYLCQKRWILPREYFNIRDRYAIGYGYEDDSDKKQQRRNHKILRFVDGYCVTFGDDNSILQEESKREVAYEIYDIRSNSWKVLDVVKSSPEWKIDFDQRGVSVKGNTYFFAHHFIPLPHISRDACREEIFLLCFDFTKERFGPRLPLPFDSFDGFNGDVVTVSSFLRGGGDDEQLAVLFGGYESGFFEIWVTLTVDPNSASWSKFLRMEPGPFAGYGFQLYTSRSGGTVFVDEENKVAVLFELFEYGTKSAHTAFVFGQDRYIKSVNLGEALILEQRNPILTYMLYIAARPPLVCFYRPSLVQVKHPLVHKRKPHVSTSQKETHVSTCSEINVKLRRLI